jgi:hypothetical protein
LGRLLVVAEFAERDHALLDGEVRQQFEHGLGECLVIGLLRIEPDAAVMADAELSGAEFLEAADGREIIDVTAEIGARLAEPQRRLARRGRHLARNAVDLQCRRCAVLRVGQTSAAAGTDEASTGLRG